MFDLREFVNYVSTNQVQPEVYVSTTLLSADGMAKSVRRGNRRATVRYHCAPATLANVYVGDEQEFQRACVLDLSVSGVGLLMGRRFDVGQLLLVCIRGNVRSRTFKLYAEVAHCDPLPMGEWIIGCELAAPLTPEDLDQLL